MSSPSVCPFICLTVCLSTCNCVHLSIRLSIYPSDHMSSLLHTCLFVCLTVISLFVHLSICLSVLFFTDGCLSSHYKKVLSLLVIKIILVVLGSLSVRLSVCLSISLSERVSSIRSSFHLLVCLSSHYKNVLSLLVAFKYFFQTLYLGE